VASSATEEDRHQHKIRLPINCALPSSRLSPTHPFRFLGKLVKKGSFSEHSHKVPTMFCPDSSGCSQPMYVVRVSNRIAIFSSLQLQTRWFAVSSGPYNFVSPRFKDGERDFNTSLNYNHPKLDTYAPSTENIVQLLE
jgi:hypothetical protein